MSSERHTFSRQEFFDLVWSKPLRKLSEELGISDVALGKICRRYQIPRPGRGYWAKLAAGKPPKQPPLPKALPSVPDAIEFGGHENSTLTARGVPRELAVIEAFERMLENRILVPEQISGYHRLVRRSRKLLKERAHPRSTSRRPVESEGAFQVVTSAQLEQRAWRIADSLVRAFEAREWPVSLDEKEGCVVSLFGETMAISIKEKTIRTEHQPSREERERKEKYDCDWYPRYDYEPSGHLTLGADNDGYRSTATVSDTARIRVEERLNEFVIKVARLAWRKHEKALAAAERERQWALEAAERQKWEVAAARERRRVDSLKHEASLYAEAEAIRRYLAEVERQIKTHSSSAELKAWHQWATNIADHLDPTRNGHVQIKNVQRNKSGSEWVGDERMFYTVY